MVEIKAEDNEEWTGVGNTKVQKQTKRRRGYFKVYYSWQCLRENGI